ncbi:MAG: YqhA family protein [Anaerolineales bacterium]|nr:YqhA family protein [Anaerolineales bacterium]
MTRILSGTRFLVLVPILGLALAAGVFFVFGSFNLISLIVESLIAYFQGTFEAAHADEVPFVIQVVEHALTFLIGTVLYITAVGLYKLFIDEVEFHGWFKIDSTEELEMKLIGVTIVVLAVNFLTGVYTRDVTALFEYGAGIALPIAVLALFVGLRAWSTRGIDSEPESIEEDMAESDSARK